MSRKRGASVSTTPLSDAENALRCADTLVELRAALESGADANARWGQRYTKLMCICSRSYANEHMTDMVRELLAWRAQPDASDASGNCALHFAAERSTPAIVAVLLATGTFVDPCDRTGATPLFRCVSRTDDENAAPIVQQLLGAGANAKHTNADGTETILTHCCMFGTATTLVLLLHHKANPDIVNVGSEVTPLMAACHNHVHGAEMIPLLAAAGANINDKTAANNRSVWEIACRNGNAAIMRALVRIYGKPPADVGVQTYHTSTIDPIGVVRMLPYAISDIKIRRSNARASAKEWWAHLRLKGPRLDGSPTHDTFNVLIARNSRKLWGVFADELQSLQHPLTGNTLLHEAAAINNVAALHAICKRATVNPLLRNKRGLMALELCTSADAREELIQYTAWHPRREWARWYGPYVRKWQRCFLLLCQRWSATGVVHFDRNVRSIIARYIANPEEC